MATKQAKTEVNPDGLTTTTAIEEKPQEIKVRVFIPLADDEEASIAVDQTETVIINGYVTRIKRGEYVDVSVPVFMQLRNRYPHL